MICYQDEKMYGPPVEGMTVEQLDKEIDRLEKILYGQNMLTDLIGSERKPMVYDVKMGKLVERTWGRS